MNHDGNTTERENHEDPFHRYLAGWWAILQGQTFFITILARRAGGLHHGGIFQRLGAKLALASAALQLDFRVGALPVLAIRTCQDRESVRLRKAMSV
jgi:hypothetical protein